MPLSPDLDAQWQALFGANSYGQPAGGAPMPGGQPPSVSLASPSNYTTPATPVPGGFTPHPTNVAEFDATRRLQTANEQKLAADTRVLDTAARTAPAQRNVAAAQERNLAANSAFLAEQARALEQEKADFDKVQAAEADTGNILSVAKQQRYRDVTAFTYKIAGLPSPIEVKLPPGHKGPMPVGVVQRLQTLAEVMTEAAADNEKMRQFNLEAARIKSANAGQEVTAAQIASGKVQLELDEAELAADRVGLGVRQASLDVAASRLPPFPGAVFDDISQQYMSPAELNEVQYQRGQTRQDAAQAQREAEAQAKLQSLGPLGSLTESELVRMYAEGAINDAQLIEGLNAKVAAGLLLQSSVDVWAGFARIQREQFLKSQASGAVPPPPPGRGSGTTTPTPSGIRPDSTPANNPAYWNPDA